MAILISVQSWSKNAWTWEDCIQYALDSNLNIINHELLATREAIRYQQSKNNIFPSLNGHSSIRTSFGKSVDQSTYDIVFEQNLYNSYRISSNVRIFNGFMHSNNIKFRKYNLMMAEETLEINKNILMFEVLGAFINIAYYKELESILRSQIIISRREYEKAVKMHELGRKAYSDILEIKAQLASDSFMIVQNKRNEEQAAFQLKELMSFPVDKELVIELPDKIINNRNPGNKISDFSLDFLEGESNRETETAINLSDIGIQPGDGSNDANDANFVNDPVENSIRASEDSIIENAKTFLPEIKKAEYELKAAEKYLKIARSNIYPSVNMNAGISTDYYKKMSTDEVQPFDEQINDNLSEWIGLSVGIPLFNRFKVRNDIKMAELDIKMAENERKKMLISIENEIKYALIELKSARSEYQSAVNQLNARKEAFKAALKKLEKGLIDQINYNLVKNQMASSEVQLMRIKLELFMKLKRVEFFVEGKIN